MRPEARRGLEFDAQSVRQRFPHAFDAVPRLYWADLLVSSAIGWGAFAGALAASATTGRIALGAVSVFALLRAATFVHELAHLKKRALPGFEVAWNAIVGLPLLLPSLVYAGSHVDHHSRTAFGTEYDPEYAPIAHWSPWRILRFVVVVALVPIVLPVRWGVLGPLSYGLPRFRRAVVERASTLAINGDYRRPRPGKRRDVWRWRLQEASAAILCWTAAWAWWSGWLPGAAVVQWYCVVSAVLAINQIRTLAAHGYENEGDQVEVIEQVLDSINLDGIPVLTPIVAPLGMQYHGLHHFLPTVPYHNLGALHRALCRELPSDAGYAATRRGSMVGAVLALRRRARDNRDLAIEDLSSAGVG